MTNTPPHWTAVSVTTLGRQNWAETVPRSLSVASSIFGMLLVILSWGRGGKKQGQEGTGVAVVREWIGKRDGDLR